ALILVAAPKVLGVVRPALHHEVSRRLIGELHKDLVKHPVREIEKLLQSA
ncbi:MAG: Host attachment protein, partial [Alphaproteobacteria bacterium]